MGSHKRSASEQVKSGFFKVGELVGGFLVFVMASRGFISLFSKEPPQNFRGLFIASSELCAAAIIMFLTAERWGGYIPGFLLLPAAMKGISYSIITPLSSTAREAFTAWQYGAMGLYGGVAIALLWRFVPPRRLNPTLLDRTALTIFALSLALSLALPPAFLSWPPLFGLSALFVSWAIYRWRVTQT